MNWATGLSRWLASRSRRVEQRADVRDPGDMGTAFGLDASFGPIETQPPTSHDALPSPGPLPWEHRLTRRSGL